MNTDIRNALLYSRSIYEKRCKILENKEALEFWEGRNASWKNLCTFANMKLNGHYQLYKITLGMLIYLLENNLYYDDYAQKLQKDLPMLKEMYAHFKSYFSCVFTEKYGELALIKINGIESVSIRVLAKANDDFRNIYIDYICENQYKYRQSNKKFEYYFPLSIGHQSVLSYKDITSEIFWTQIHYYQSLFKDDEYAMDHAIKNVCHFYRWLITKYSDHDFFAGSSNMTTELMLSNALVKNIKRGAYFTTLNKTENLGDKPLICFIIRNYDKYSTRLKKVDQFVLSTENVNTPFYRVLVNQYVQNAASVTEATWCGFVNYTTNVLHFIEQIKAQPDYPNQSLYHLNTAEAVLIRNFFEQDGNHINLSTLNNKIGAARRFFMWCKNTAKLSFDDTFFDYFSQYEEPNMGNGNAIPESDLRKLSEAFQAVCKEDISFLPYYAIFLIQIETEFRVSQICSLKTSAIQPTMKDDQFLIHSNTKTSNGRKESQPINIATKKILERTIELTQELRDSSVSTAFAENIFLKRSYNGAVVPFTANTFLSVFKEICTKAGVKKYTSRNLRDTHMTKAFEFILKSGKSDLEMGILSKHTHIDTTKSHYIEMELTKMLESTYEVILDSRDVTQRGHILEELPDSLKDKESVVEGGCGHCSASMCAVQGSTPCLICENFITTAAHKQYFIKMIDMVEKRIQNAVIPHEVEDLNLMKKLYVSWLREIYIHEEEEEDAECGDN